MKKNRVPLKSFGGLWNLKEFLGSGAFGEVHYWVNTRTGQEIATKRLKPNLKLRPDEISVLCKRWLQEYEWMQMLTTECIVAAVKINDSDFLQYLIEQSHVENAAVPIIIMEYCNGGDLRGHLNKIENKNGLVEYEVRSILYTLRESIKYLHLKCNIEHRDIKPENIVLHVKNNQKIYKLTDFGYAREIPESTVAQSVVGTRNYVAPEVIDPGCYTQTVDYWSAGQVAFEILCGTLPFIPHQNFVKRIEAIKAKPLNCINIVQKVDDPNNEAALKFVYKLPYNHCSSLFNNHMEKWLFLSLDKNYKTRGYNEFKELKFFTLLDEILNTKILTVFSLKKCTKYYYDIESFHNMAEFLEKLAFDNGIDMKNLFLITPPAHPNKHFNQPSDYFVPEWCDTSHVENPPVMLFVNEFVKQGESNIDLHSHFKRSETIVKCMTMYAENAEIPPWLLQQFESEVHFTLAEKQNVLKCYLLGIKQFVMQVQHAVFFYENTLTEINDKILMLAGNIQMFSTVIDELKQQRNSNLQESIIEAEVKQFLIQTQNDINVIKKTYKSIFRKCKELAEDELYTRIIEEDLFLLKEYRFHISHGSNVERLCRAQHCFENCTQKFSSFFNDNGQRKTITDTIYNEINNYNALQYAVIKIRKNMDMVAKKVEKATRSLLKDFYTNNELSSQMDTLHIDGTKPNISINGTNTSFALNCDSMSLINDSLELMDAINSQCNLLNSPS